MGEDSLKLSPCSSATQLAGSSTSLPRNYYIYASMFALLVVGRASLVTFYTSQAFLVVSWILRTFLYEGRLQIWGNKTEHGKTKKLPSDQLPASPWLCFSPCAVASYVTACTRLILGSGSKASDELRESVFSGVSTILPSPTAWKMLQGQPGLH